MADAIRIWGVDGDALSEVPRQTVDLESRLEDWMDSDVSVLSDDLLVIGRQLDTDGGGILDLLCLDGRGDVVVVELKRGKTPRDVVAQMLDYAAWAGGLSYEQVVEIGDRTLGGEGTLESAFRARFDTDLPEVLNTEHHMLVVASEVDPRSERILRYLSETHGVSINAVTFNYFRTPDGGEFLARTHLIEPDAVEDRTVRRSGSKRRRSATLEDHREVAERFGVADVFDTLVDTLSRWYRPGAGKTMVTFGQRGKWMAMLNIVTSESETGALRYNAYTHRVARAFGLTHEEVCTLLPPDAEPWVYSTDTSASGNEWEGVTGTFRSTAEVERLVAGLAAAPLDPAA
ncbi:DUF91 domain-containing protein [Rubrivirga sp. IMCC43871]|uniref:DUF91 domain-containing protein n=1 Tax=Rubrivirga sp. IMCC43871 TaxID=3391575 RepID=UPI00398FFE44